MFCQESPFQRYPQRNLLLKRSRESREEKVMSLYGAKYSFRVLNLKSKLLSRRQENLLKARCLLPIQEMAIFAFSKCLFRLLLRQNLIFLNDISIMLIFTLLHLHRILFFPNLVCGQPKQRPL